MIRNPSLICRLTGLPFLAFLVLALVTGDVAAQGKTSVSSSAGRPNAVILELPRNPDPCGAFLANMPPRYRNLTLQFGPVDLDTKKLFLLKCNEKKDELIETVTGPIEELKSKAQGAVQSEIDRVRNDLTGGFWAFVSQMMLEQLPESERQKYAPGSDEALALAHEWLNDPSAELALYVDAYFSQPGNGSRLYEAYRAYIDVTNGESKAIVEDLNGVLDRAKARLSQVLNANSAAQSAAPETPTTEILENVGLSGEWVDNFKSYEGQIRDFDKNWKVQEALGIMQGAFATDVPHEKVRAFFDLMDTMSSLASDSKIPLVSLVGDIIGSYAQIANQTLDAVLALGETIKKRHGFCLGLGVATDDPRSSYFSDQGVLACPMALQTWPFRHIYEAQEKHSGQLFFWDGSAFIPGENGGGRPAVLAALRLIEAAEGLGYQLQKDPTDHVKLLAAVTNTAHPGGVPGLLDEADRIVSGLDTAADRIARVLSLSDACSADQVLQTAGDRARFSLPNFRNELKQSGTSRLTAAIAASFLALEGTIGSGRRTEAFQTYFEAEERLRSLSFLILEGRVLDQERRPVANAALDIRMRNGEEPRGCETWKADESGRFFVYAIGAAPGLAIDIRASAADAADRSERFDTAHFRATSRRIVEDQGTLFARAPGEIILQVETEPDPTDDPSGPKDEDDGASGDGDTTATDEEAARMAALCQAAQGRLDEALRLATDGQFTAARALLETLTTAPCDDIVSEAAGLEAEIVAIVSEAMDRARVTAGQCEPSALQAAAESLDALDDPGARSLQADITARIPTLTSAIGAFEDARIGYKAGYLASARAGLIEARGFFGRLAGMPDCSRYLERIASGIDKIDRLETALHRADQAIVSCEAGTIAAFQARFSELAEQHVLIAAKAGILSDTRGNIERATGLIASAAEAQVRGEAGSAALFIGDARRILDGPLAGSNCDTLRAGLENAEAQQPAPDDRQTQAEHECTSMVEMQARGEAAYRDSRLGSARDIFATMVRVMPDASLLTDCGDVAGEAARWSRHIAEAIALVTGVQRAVDRCNVGAFDGLEEKLTRHPIDQARQAMARLEAARDSCAAVDDDTELSGSTRVTSDESDDPDPEETQTTGSSPPSGQAGETGSSGSATQTATSRDGNWTGTGQFPLSAAGQRIVLELRIDLTLSNGQSRGHVSFFNDGQSMGRFPISGTFDGSRIVHEDRWIYEGLTIRNAFRGRFSSDTGIDGDGFLSLPEINCLAKAIGEMAGEVAAGALGAFSDDDDGGDAPCPLSRYPLRWSAQKR